MTYPAWPGSQNAMSLTAPVFRHCPDTEGRLVPTMLSFVWRSRSCAARAGLLQDGLDGFDGERYDADRIHALRDEVLHDLHLLRRIGLRGALHEGVLSGIGSEPRDALLHVVEPGDAFDFADGRDSISP